MKNVFWIYCCLVSVASAWAQNVTVKEADQFCQVESFSPGKDKAPTRAFQLCAGLRDAKELPTTSYEACKTLALEKARQCLHRIKVDQIAVKARFVSRLSVSQDVTRFTCELGRDGTSACP